MNTDHTDDPTQLPPLALTAGEIARSLAAELAGDPDAPVDRVRTLHNADERSLTFVRDERHAARLASANAAAALAPRALADRLRDTAPRTAVIAVENPDLALIEILAAAEAKDPHRNQPLQPGTNTHPNARVHPTATIAHNATIESGAVVEANAVIGPGAVVRYRCRIGERVTVHPNAVIGADGFGYRPAPDGKGIIKVPHIGNTVIEHDAEIGAGTCVDRAKLDTTRIGPHTKIDNLVQIGHNVTVGAACIICGRVGIAGSVTIGNAVTIGGAAGIADNLTIGDNASLAAFSALKDHLPANEQWVGVPAVPRREWVRAFAATRKLANPTKRTHPHDKPAP